MKRIISLSLVLLLALSVLACSSKATDYAMPEATEGYWDVMTEEVKNDADFYPEESSPYGISTSGSPQTNVDQTVISDRKIIKNADLTVETLEFDAFLPGLEELVNDLSGYMESVHVNGNRYTYSNGLRSASMTIRIPAEQLDPFLNHLDKMSNVLSKTVVVDDVTTEYVDIESRLSVLRDEKTALSNILANATDTSDIIVVQSQLYDVIEEIEAYEARLRSLDSLVAYSTVQLYVEEVKEPTPAVEETRGDEFKRRWKENISDFGEGLVDFGIWFVVSLPNILLILAIMTGVFFLVLGIVKGAKKRRAKKRAQKETQA